MMSLPRTRRSRREAEAAIAKSTCDNSILQGESSRSTVGFSNQKKITKPSIRNACRPLSPKARLPEKAATCGVGTLARAATQKPKTGKHRSSANPQEKSYQDAFQVIMNDFLGYVEDMQCGPSPWKKSADQKKKASTKAGAAKSKRKPKKKNPGLQGKLLIADEVRERSQETPRESTLYTSTDRDGPPPSSSSLTSDHSNKHALSRKKRRDQSMNGKQQQRQQAREWEDEFLDNFGIKPSYSTSFSDSDSDDETVYPDCPHKMRKKPPQRSVSWQEDTPTFGTSFSATESEDRIVYPAYQSDEHAMLREERFEEIVPKKIVSWQGETEKASELKKKKKEHQPQVSWQDETEKESKLKKKKKKKKQQQQQQQQQQPQVSLQNETEKASELKQKEEQQPQVSLQDELEKASKVKQKEEQHPQVSLQDKTENASELKQKEEQQPKVSLQDETEKASELKQEKQQPQGKWNEEFVDNFGVYPYEGIEDLSTSFSAAEPFTDPPDNYTSEEWERLKELEQEAMQGSKERAIMQQRLYELMEEVEFRAETLPDPSAAVNSLVEKLRLKRKEAELRKKFKKASKQHKALPTPVSVAESFLFKMQEQRIEAGWRPQYDENDAESAEDMLEPPSTAAELLLAKLEEYRERESVQQELDELTEHAMEKSKERERTQQQLNELMAQVDSRTKATPSPSTIVNSLVGRLRLSRKEAALRRKTKKDSKKHQPSSVTESLVEAEANTNGLLEILERQRSQAKDHQNDEQIREDDESMTGDFKVMLNNDTGGDEDTEVRSKDDEMSSIALTPLAVTSKAVGAQDDESINSASTGASCTVDSVPRTVSYASTIPHESSSLLSAHSEDSGLFGIFPKINPKEILACAIDLVNPPFGNETSTRSTKGRKTGMKESSATYETRQSRQFKDDSRNNIEIGVPGPSRNKKKSTRKKSGRSRKLYF